MQESTQLRNKMFCITFATLAAQALAVAAPEEVV